MNRYCTSANMKALQDIYLMRSFAVTAARTLGRNIAFAEYQARNDLNWERRKQAAALGRKLGGDASSLIKSAGAGLASIGAGYEQGLNSALKALGYESARMFGDQGPTYEQVNAQFYTDTSRDTVNAAVQNNEDFNFASYNTGYQSNGGNPMYGAESAGMANGLATNISSNVTDQPSDLITEGDFRGEGNGFAYDGDDMPSIYKDSLNENMPGAQDKVRSGKWAFPVQGGGKGFVEVDMDKFAVAYADHLNANLTDPAKGPAASDPGWP
jgi:hypothetical protein